MADVFVIHNYLTKEELESLRRECTSHVNSAADPSELGASIDLFEESNISESSLIRHDAVSYFAERWKRSCDRNGKMEDCIAAVLLRRLPGLCKALCPSHPSWYLFNEHYVVKSVDSELEFRWHTDSNEQLLAMPLHSRPLYWSLWCPLQDVSSTNGTLAFPMDTRIHYLESIDSLPTVTADVRHGCECPSEDEAGIEVDIPAGSVVLFDSVTYHRSGPNLSQETRQVFYAQYSSEVISVPTSGSHKGPSYPLCFGVPCIV